MQLHPHLLTDTIVDITIETNMVDIAIETVRACVYASKCLCAGWGGMHKCAYVLVCIRARVCVCVSPL